MSDYLAYLESISSNKVSETRIRYFNYNFKRFYRKDMNVLEIGPGLGEFLSLISGYQPKTIDLLDFDQPTITHLSKNFKIRKSWVMGVEQIPAIASDLGKYDLIFMNQILEHAQVSSLVDILKTLYASLEVGGHLIITVPNGNNPLASVERYSDITHQNLFSTNSFRQLCRMSGISEQEQLIQAYKTPPSSFRNILGIQVQKIVHLILKVLVVCNGGVHFSPMHPNISLIVTKKELKLESVSAI